MGMVMRAGLADKKVFLPSWSSSICRTYDRTKRFRERIERESGSKYWTDYTWLYEESQKRHQRLAAKIPDKSALA
jgi:hypothetical protein